MFKVGDLVRANKLADEVHCFTKFNTYKAVVTKVFSEEICGNDMEIKVLESGTTSTIGNTYPVEARCFELIKTDCNNTETYLKERARMREYNIKCKIGCICRKLEDSDPKEAISIVQKWSDEHPVKTYKDVFLEKFPNATLDEYGYPKLPVSYVFGGFKGYTPDFRANWDIPYTED